MMAWAFGRRRPIGGLLLLVALAGLVFALWRPVTHHLRAASLLLRVEGVEGGVPGWLARLGTHAVAEQELDLPHPNGSLPARRYRPRDRAPAARVLLVHGVHFRGMDEPRLVALARALAAAGMDVLTPHMASLAAFRIEPQAVQRIHDAAAWFAALDVPQGGAPASVGVFGISFAGGLALMAAADGGGDTPIGWVVAVGAHHDLARVGRWYAGQEALGPEGEAAAASPHPYGAGVFIRGGLERFFPQEDVPIAARALDRILRERSREAKALLPELTAEGQAQLGRILSREPHPELSRSLLALVRDEVSALRAVSPRGRLDRLEVPVLLLHGAEDPVVPSFETRWLARELPARPLRRVLITPLLRHAEAREKPSLRDEIQLVRFLATMLAVAER